MFMRYAALPLGPAFLIEARVLLAALVLAILALYLKKQMQFRQHAKHYFILGFFNSALPFLLFAYAAQTVNASLLSVLNSTAPLWAAIITAIWTRTMPTINVQIGLFSGLVGVVFLAGWHQLTVNVEQAIAILAATIAACSYGIATNYAKYAPKIESYNNAHGSMWASVVLILPLLPFMPIRDYPNEQVIGAVLVLGVVCTGLAYLFYFRLVSDVGPSSALTVTFLIPVFGILWGHTFLNEEIGTNTIVGAVFVIFGTMLVTGFSIKQLWQKRVL